MKKALVFLALLVVPLASIFAPSPSLAGYNSVSAKTYLFGQAQNPWTTMALAAAGETPVSLEHLRSVSGSSAIAYSAPILALTAAGKNPSSFGQEDYVAKLKSFASQGQLGDPASLNDDIFGLLALISAGEPKNSALVSGIKDHLLANQGNNGAWGFATGGGGDTDMTAAGIAALIAAGADKQDPKIQAALNYLKTNQTEEGGFVSSPAFDTQANTSSTAWAVWALNALGINPESWSQASGNPVSYLQNAQAAEGWFAYQAGQPSDGFTPITTAYAVIALSGKTLPIQMPSSTKPLPAFKFRIEGKNETLCEGQSPAQNALELVKNASEQCQYSYAIKDTPYGPYLAQINSDAGENLAGWQYAVNYSAPSVGAADYLLKDSEEVLWYFGEWNDRLSRISLDKTSIAAGEKALATVEYKEGDEWAPLSGATLHMGLGTLATDQNGQAELSGSDGYYRVYSEKPGHVRSNAVLLKIGKPNSSSVNLSINIPGVNGEETLPPEKPEIAFSVNPASLDFGSLMPGQKSEKELKINNSGKKTLQISSVTEGDAIFVENLRLQSAHWKNFRTQILGGQESKVQAGIALPKNLSSYGKKQGQLIFWAQAE